MGGDRVCKYCYKLNRPDAGIPLPEDFEKPETGGEEEDEKTRKID
jgi:hypothetical protein